MRTDRTLGGSSEFILVSYEGRVGRLRQCVGIGLFVAIRAKRCLASPGSWGVFGVRIFFGWRSAIGVPVFAVLGCCLAAFVSVRFFWRDLIRQ